MSDGELVRQTLAGRNAAYGELVRRYAGRITALCQSKVRRADVAEDLAQEALLRGFRALGTLTDPNKFGTWLYGIALRACLDWLKAKERTTVPFSVLNPDGQPDQCFPHFADAEEPELDQADERGRLLAEVNALPEEYREALVLYYYGDHTYRDIGEMLGVSAATVNARLTKARVMLRERLTAARK
jgi:RNA polymerase sigma-70 factor (ECF subfamily)